MALANQLNCKRLMMLASRESYDNFASALEGDEIPYLFWRAPEPPRLVVPTGTWNDRNKAIARFAAGAESLADVATGDHGDVRSKGDRHALFGNLYGVQLALFAADHTERNRAEIVGLARSSDTMP